VELLIVIVMVAILMALLFPAVGSAYKTARTVKCAWNLRHLYSAIMLEKQEGLAASEYMFPTAYDWPEAALSMVEQPEVIGRCPEDERTDDTVTDAADADTSDGPTDPDTLMSQAMGFDIAYWSCMEGGFFIPFDPSHYLCVARTGVDEQGRPYVEYACEENPNPYVEGGTTYKGAKWSGRVDGYSENDGVWRITMLPDGSRILKLMSSTCPAANALWYSDKLLWENLISHVGEEISIGRAMAISFTSYGLNLNVSEQPRVSPGAILLLDFKDRIIDPTAADIQSLLDDPDSARHDSKHNVLFAEGSVRLIGSASLYPQIFPDVWSPW